MSTSRSLVANYAKSFCQKHSQENLPEALTMF